MIYVLAGDKIKGCSTVVTLINYIFPPFSGEVHFVSYIYMLFESFCIIYRKIVLHGIPKKGLNWGALVL